MRLQYYFSRRHLRRAFLFLLLMIFMTIFLLMRHVVINDEGQFEREQRLLLMPFKRSIPKLMLSLAGSLVPVQSATEPINGGGSLQRRWYLPSCINDSQAEDYCAVSKLGDLRSLWPEQNSLSDRIENQLLYLPAAGAAEDYDDIVTASSTANHLAPITAARLSPAQAQRPILKTIFLPEGLAAWNVPEGRELFLTDNCPVNECRLTAEAGLIDSADAVLMKNRINTALQRRQYRPHQVWILYLLESPFHSPNFAAYKNTINWTATYRSDSDIVAPYEKFVLYDPAVREKPQDINYAEKKSGKGKVAWFVSNCGASNNRLAYAQELSKYISVDIYGTCGNKQCGRNDQQNCKELLRTDYKFYLAFENSNCRWYITEKLWDNALTSDVIPIAMGAPLDDYEELAPFNSFIHVDQFPGGPRDLAEYLHLLDANATLYNQYFRWKGTGQLINTHFFCRLCAMLHSDRSEKVYEDVNEWWRGAEVCTRSSWQKTSQKKRKR